MAKQKIAIIGLGHFGLQLALRMTELGAEVLGIDVSEERVEMVRDRIAHAMIMDTTDPRALAQIGLRDFDIVIIAIGEDFEASLLTSAHVQELKVKRLINRVVSGVHERILKLMQVDELILPEAEAAMQLARRLTFRGLVESLEVSDDYSVSEVTLPEWAVGKTLHDLNLRQQFNLNLVTIIRKVEESGPLGFGKKVTKKVLGVPASETLFEAGDLLVLFGKETDIRKFLS